MNIPPDLRLTDSVFWWGALILALVDAAWAALLVWRIKPAAFAGLRGWLVLISTVYWAGLWLWVMTNFWDVVYGYFFPVELRGWLPVIFGAAYAAIAWVLWWLSARRRRPVMIFLLLGALLGAETHLIAISRGILVNPPMLSGVSPLPVLLFATFEFGLYWCLILTVAALLRWLAARVR